MIASTLSHWNVTAAGLRGMIAVRRTLPVALDIGLDMVRTVVSNRLRLPTVNFKSWSWILYLALILPQTGMSFNCSIYCCLVKCVLFSVMWTMYIGLIVLFSATWMYQEFSVRGHSNVMKHYF